QELKDVQDGQRILEKKGSAALKDLRRQLQLERRRGERLQERLQELLVPSRARSGQGGKKHQILGWGRSKNWGRGGPKFLGRRSKNLGW
ncbi:GRAP1 protein, partial [Zosterops hypoxanthus]|nr:GRAP1 protein [Zosterops hypoxanthus]